MYVSSQVLPPSDTFDDYVIESFKLGPDMAKESLEAEITIRGTESLIDQYVQNLKRRLEEANLEKVGAEMIVYEAS